MRSLFHNGTKTRCIVKGDRECIFRKLDNNEYLLSIYQDDLQGDYREEQGSKTNEPAPFYLLNQSAAIGWYFLKDCPTPESLLGLLKEYYPNQDQQEIAKGLDNFLKKLYQLHLISLSEDSRAKNNTSAFSYSVDDAEIKQMLKEKQKYSPFCIEPLVIDQALYVQTETCLLCEPGGPEPVNP